ncbi:MAG: cysteine desulfurase family protein [Candidatus Jordarchaeales archaeon]|nr:cysteine desulfurase [Candidatus Jordarchaeia archaeon]
MGDVEELIKAHGELKREVYLDFENSSPVPGEILEVMLPYFNRVAYGNPTLTHKPGWEAYEAISKSAEKIASFIGSKEPEEINFTPGETEANNLALIGAALRRKEKGRKILVSEVEPLSILHVCRMLENYGFTTVNVPVDEEGFINLERLKELADREVILASFMAVNNEIGTIEPLREAVEIVKDKSPEAIFHTDASDAYGRVRFDVGRLDVDLATISSYKILGPRGIGALYVKGGVSLEKILEGQFGTQKLWPGVENTPLIVGFAAASEKAFSNFDGNVAHMARLRDKLISGILNGLDGTILNGPLGDRRAPDNVNVSFLKCEGESLTVELSLRGVYVSSGSACTRRILQPSHVLLAIGRRFEEAHGSILMKVTRYHTDEDIEYVLQSIREAVSRLRMIYGSMGG